MTKPDSKDSRFDSYEEYARKMDLFMDGPTTTHFQMLLDAGIELPEPDSLTDEQISAKLWEIVHGLAGFRAYLSETNHLSDRELYVTLWHDTLRVEEPAIDEIGFTTHIGLLSGGGEPETSMYLRYYADEDYRNTWLEHVPDYEMPQHEDPAYDRDRHLPQPNEEPLEPQ